jgi:hypothetical protein
MIEWAPIKEFLEKNNFKQEEYFLVYNIKNNNITTFSLLTASSLHLPTRFTHAAKINFPVEKTLEEKFSEYLKSHMRHLTEYETIMLAKIAKEHYEGGKE